MQRTAFGPCMISKWKTDAHTWQAKKNCVSFWRHCVCVCTRARVRACACSCARTRVYKKAEPAGSGNQWLCSWLKKLCFEKLESWGSMPKVTGRSFFFFNLVDFLICIVLLCGLVDRAREALRAYWKVQLRCVQPTIPHRWGGDRGHNNQLLWRPHHPLRGETAPQLKSKPQANIIFQVVMSPTMMTTFQGNNIACLSALCILAVQKLYRKVVYIWKPHLVISRTRIEATLYPNSHCTLSRTRIKELAWKWRPNVFM